ncbi:MAG: hypothetical protein LBS75_04570 [Synergistaceae bacterium]|nr:hypothetical protein [Synergistaceae bacterium]
MRDWNEGVGENEGEYTLTVSWSALRDAAAAYFERICGLSEDNPKAGIIRRGSYALLEEIAPSIDIRARIRALGRECVGSEFLEVSGIRFPCCMLREPELPAVTELYAVVITAGDIAVPDGSMTAALYGDLWGTAYVNAASDFVRDALEGGRGVCLREGAGPGWYDMSAALLPDFFRIVDGGKIGVAVTGNMMEPVKSVACFYLGFEREPRADVFERRCQYCLSESRGCDFCKLRLTPICNQGPKVKRF